MSGNGDVAVQEEEVIVSKYFLPHQKVDVKTFHRRPLSDRSCETILGDSFQQVFGISKGLLRTRFKKYCREVFKEEFPSLRCSTVRAIYEGRVPGIPKPCDKIQHQWKNSIEHALFLCDLFETLMFRYMEEEKEAKQREEMEERSRQRKERMAATRAKNKAAAKKPKKTKEEKIAEVLKDELQSNSKEG